MDISIFSFLGFLWYVLYVEFCLHQKRFKYRVTCLSSPNRLYNIFWGLTSYDVGFASEQETRLRFDLWNVGLAFTSFSVFPVSQPPLMKVICLTTHCDFI